MTKESFYGTEDKCFSGRHTWYIPYSSAVFHLGSSVPQYEWTRHAVLSTASEKMHGRAFLQRGSACSTIWPRFSLLPQCRSVCLSVRLAHSHSCRAGNLFNSHTLSRWWCCPNAHTHAHRLTRQVHVVRTTPLKEFSHPSFPSKKVRDFYSVYISCFIEVVSIAVQSRISEDVRCKRGKGESCVLSC